MSTKILIRTALILALCLMFQSLRFIIPLPPLFSTFLLGSLVNACLLTALITAGVWPALLIAVVTPLVAYIQSLLPLPIFIFPVALGNAIFIMLFKILTGFLRNWQAIAAAALGKTLWLYFAFWFILSILALPAKMSALLLAVMSWPQFVTGCIGGVLFMAIKNRISVLGK